MSWAAAAMRKLTVTGCYTMAALSKVLSGREVSLSSAFSGVGTEGTASRIICNSAARFLGNHAIGGPMRFVHEYAIEAAQECQLELMGPLGPNHIYTNIMDFNKPGSNKIRAALGLGQGSFRSAHCARCNKDCFARTCDISVAGSPCTDHSTFGKQEGMAGKQCVPFGAWCRLKRRTLDKVILHENVPSFGAH